MRTKEDRSDRPAVGKMPQDEERRLIKRYQQGDPEAAGLLIAQHERALHYFASSVFSRCESEDDLFQQACIFFLLSLRKYKLRNAAKVRVTTWCYFYVRRALRSYSLKTGLIRLPHMALSTDRPAAELAMKRMGKVDDTVHELGRRCTDFDGVDDREERERLERAMLALSSRQREVLEWRMLGWKLKDIGDMLGLSKERVRQVEVSAIARLKLHCLEVPTLLR